MLPFSRSYSRFVTADSDSPLDRSRGRVQLIDGDLYYSPNSQRSVRVPPVYDNIPFSDNFKDSFSRFRRPLWWQPACPYLAFVPTQPVFAGVPFQDLFHISIFPRRSDRSYAIDPKIILGWASLERDIRDAANLILAHEGAPPITWLIPTSLGCTGGYRYIRLLRTEYTNSKDWFSLFMGGLSYAIAISISQRQESFYQDMPNWFAFLYERGYSQIWLSGIRTSTVASFDSSVDRAGVFVQLLQRHQGQYSIDWLCSFGIPVWYPWGTRESQASLSDIRLARFAPLPHQLQENSTFLTKNPSPQVQPTTQSQPTTEPRPMTEPQTGAYDCKLFMSYFPPNLY